MEIGKIEYLVFFEDKVIWEEASTDANLIDFLKAEINDSYVARIEKVDFENEHPFRFQILNEEEYNEEFEDDDEEK